MTTYRIESRRRRLRADGYHIVAISETGAETPTVMYETEAEAREAVSWLKLPDPRS